MKNYIQKFILLLALVFVISFNTNAQVSGCLDSNATNYDSTATEQSYNEWGMLVCLYESCYDVSNPGCISDYGFHDFTNPLLTETDITQIFENCVVWEGELCSGLEGIACPYDIYEEYEQDADEYSDLACLTLITSGCMDPSANNFNPAATNDDGSCAYVYGCTNDLASNFNADATTDDGSCVIFGCTDAAATNFFSAANQDDGSCTYSGCTNSVAENFDLNADVDNGTCIISGCMLEVFPNYNPIATQSDGSCSFDAEELITGCTDQDTWTYNPNANFDDGSCSNELTVGAIGQGGIVFHIDTENELAYVVSLNDLEGGTNPHNNGYLGFRWGCSGTFLSANSSSEENALGTSIGSGLTNTEFIINLCNESNIAAELAFNASINNHNDWYLPSIGELFEIHQNIPSQYFTNGSYWSSTENNFDGVEILNLSTGYYHNDHGKNGYHIVRPIRHFSYSASGCTDPFAFNYQPSATQDDGSCIAVVEGCLSSWAENFNSQANTPDNSCYLNGCTSIWADNYNSQATLDDGSCLLAACNQLWADNYDQNATSNDGSCYLNGCMSQWADNYNAQATIDDGSCSLAGCALEFAENYNVYVTVDDGSCEITGCTNEFAMNFDNSATQDDGSCTYYNTAYIPDAELLNYLKADYSDAIVNDSLNIDQAHLITSININLDIDGVPSFDISSFVGLELCSNIEELRIEGSSVSDLSPLYNNTGIRSLTIQGGNITSESINSLLSIQTSIESIEIQDNSSIGEFNILLPNHFMDMVIISNTEIESINLMVDGLTYIDISGNNNLQTISGIGDFDIHTMLQIAENESLTSISGSTLSDNYNQSNWQQDAVYVYGNPLLTSCCPLGGFPNFIINSFWFDGESGNGENCNSGSAITTFYDSNCAPGCTDPAALNYNPNISEDDGSCEYCPEIEVVAAVSNISCITNDADVSVTVYPAGNYNFEWSSGQNTSTVYDIPSDAYTVTVTNADGCSESLNIDLETPSQISIEANVIDDDLGQCAGEILTTISGGDGEYSFQWYDDNNQTTQNASDLCAGNYLIEVTDGSGCSASSSFDVGGGIPWSFGITGSNHSLFIQDSTIFNLYNSEISFGDYIGGFYIDESTGELKCGGYTIWQESQTVIPLWGDDSDTPEKDGFFENDRIIIGIYKNAEGREYFGESEYYETFPNTEYYNTNGFSSLKEFNGKPSPNWFTTNTGNSHSIMLTEFDPVIGEEPLVYGDFIGVFFTDFNGQLRCGGKTIWTGENQGLAVWGDDGTSPEKDGFAPGEAMIWKVWKATELESFTTFATFGNNPSNSVNYSVNGLSILLSLYINVNQNLNLPQGWSMFSLNIEPVDSDFTVLLEPIIDNVRLVKNYSGQAYIADYNFNGIGALERGEGYQIKLEEAQVLSLTGSYIYPENNPLTIPSGWSMISYLRTEPAAVDQVLSFVNQNENLRIFKDYLGRTYLPEYGFNGIGDFTPGQGYQIKLVETDTLLYLSNNTEYRESYLPSISKQLSGCKTPILTDNNMTVVIPEHAWDKLPSINTEIRAYDELGQVIGCSKLNSPVTVMTVWGDDFLSSNKDGLYVDEQINFKVYDNDSSQNLKITEWSEGSEFYELNAYSVASSVTIQSEEVQSENVSIKSIVKIINLLGQEVDESKTKIGRLLFRVYDDGSVEKFIK